MSSTIKPVIVPECIQKCTPKTPQWLQSASILYAMDSLKHSKFESFERADFAYSKIGDHSLIASVLTPKKVQEQAQRQVPVLIFWHGGGFVVGDRLYEPWWSDWLIEYALSKDALLIAPNYRLMPEATGADILDDLEAFWDWLHTFLPSFAQSNSWKVQPDLTRLLCVGQSAGGCMAVQSALIQPELNIKAIVSLYAPLYNNVPSFTVPHPRHIMGTMPPPPRQAEGIIRSYIKKTKGSIRTVGDPVQMWELLLCMLQQGRLPSLMTARPDARLDTISLLKQVKKLPPIWLIHGEEDSVIPFKCSEMFLAQLRAVLPMNPVMMSSRHGEHNFETSLTMEEAWIQEGCEFLSKHW